MANESRDRSREELPAFTVDPRINLTLDYNLAIELGQLIRRVRPNNPALAALGFRLRSIEESPPPSEDDREQDSDPQIEGSYGRATGFRPDGDGNPQRIASQND